ncbi:MAG: hypothetical protein K8T90_02330, partial [Planctomycetes bacterium]|nr:hypothetical protein [Planctomycetota bacterium]
MRIRRSIVLTAAAAGIVLVSAVPDADRPTDRPTDRRSAPPTDCGADQAVARREVARLAAWTAAERDEAAAALAELGDVAVPVLRDALREPDAEVRDRARSILRKLTATAATVSRDRYREAVSLLRAAPVADGAPSPGPEAAARLRELAPESGRALADWALRASQRTFVGAPLALALTRFGTDDSLAALAKLWRAERLSPSAALMA